MRNVKQQGLLTARRGGFANRHHVRLEWRSNTSCPVRFLILIQPALSSPTGNEKSALLISDFGYL